MSATDRLQSEQAFHEQQARERAETFARHPERLRFEDEAYLGHETWIRPALERLGEVSGRDILDLGCGHGMAAVVLARRGAHVRALDLSLGYVQETRRRAEANGVVIDLVQADGEHLPFADESFDRIWGSAILHHLHIPKAAAEVHRALRPGGVAVFCEPWGENPLLRWARQKLHYPGKERTADEQPLRRRDLAVLRRTFAQVHVQGFQLLSMARRILASGRVLSGLEYCDRLLLASVPRLQDFCRYLVLTLRK